MSISAISPYTPSSSVGGSSQANQNPIAQALKTLQTDIAQGDTTGAETALTSLEKALGNSPSGAPAANSPLGEALTQLQTSLQSGNSSSAQTALAALKSAMRHGHHHHGGSSVTAGGSSGATGGSGNGTSAAVPSQSSSGSVLNALA
jgi:hypothetical protein